MQHQYLLVGQPVNFIEPGGKILKGKIIIVHGEHDVTIELPGGTAVAGYSDHKEPGTFHFAETKAAEAKASVKAASE
jgi:hypothetical protein